MNRDVIEAFLREMRENHQEEINAIELPEGTREYLLERIRAEDTDTLTFMLKLSYLMGLQTGFAAQMAEDDAPPTPRGPLQA